MLNELEKIDDDCDRHGIVLVKMDEPEYAASLGIDRIPALVYFENSIPFLFDGNLANEDEVLGWLLHQMKSDEIEQVTDEMLDKIVEEYSDVALVICEFFAVTPL